MIFMFVKKKHKNHKIKMKEIKKSFKTLWFPFVKGKKKANNVTAWLVPGSKQVEAQIVNEGLKDIFEAAGFQLRQPGCSACLAMNDDKIPKGEYCVSTSNRNFEGRQGQGSRTILASPLVAAATAVEGKIIDITKHLHSLKN